MKENSKFGSQIINVIIPDITVGYSVYLKKKLCNYLPQH